MKKIKHYKISCQAYGTELDKLEGTYVVSVKLDDVLDKQYTKVHDPDEGRVIINNLIKDYKFRTFPDLTIYDSPLLGKMIETEN